MKTVAVLVPSFTIEYVIEVLSGIYDYFADKQVRVIVAQTKLPYGNPGPYDYQYWTNMEYLRSKDVDGYIFLSGVFTSGISQEEFNKIITSFAPRPVVSIGAQIDLPNVYSIIADCKQSYLEIVTHLKEKHNCKKILFCSANKTGSSEALERFQSFKDALEQNHLPFFEDQVLDGYFTDFGACQSFKDFFPTRESVDCDAIVCANDSMAAGCIKALKEYGFNVPGDVKVTGFDDSIVSRISEPKLSTINQEIYKQGYSAAEQILTVLEKSTYEKQLKVHLAAKFRQSCGCTDCKEKDDIYFDVDGNKKTDVQDSENSLIQFGKEMNEKNNLISLMDTVKGANTLKQFFFNLRFIADQCSMTCASVNLFKDVLYLDQNEVFELPESMELYMVADRDHNSETFKPGLLFNPKEEIFSARSFKETPGIYIINPVFAAESNYGYILCKVLNKNFADHIVHLKIIVTAIAQSCDYTNQILENQKLLSEKSDLKKQSRTDELTGILNRRGFIEQGQETIDVIQETENTGLVFFADMDGLKYINDTFGHEMGDQAIKTQAEVLKEAFGENDVIGRLGGDEFGIVAVNAKLKSLESTRLKVDMLNKKYSIKNNFPFTLSISLGAVDLQSSSVLKKILVEADKSLYEEKHKHHERLSGRS